MTRITVDVPDTAVPGQHGVYVVLDAVEEVLYIGRTQDLINRLRAHRRAAPWWKFTRKIEFTPCADAVGSRQLEKSMIATFHPDANVNDRLPIAASKVAQELPGWTASKLRSLYCDAVAAGWHSDSNALLNGYILALRQAGWKLAAIGAALEVTREAVRLREAQATHVTRRFGVPSPPRKLEPIKAVKPSISTADVAKMRALFVGARKVNGATPLDHPSRQDSIDLSELMAEIHLSGVSIYRIAKTLGVSHLAVRARLARHGYLAPITGLQGNARYRGIRTPHHGPASHCKRGHPLSGANLRLVNGDPQLRHCRACTSIRSAEYQARKKASA